MRLDLTVILRRLAALAVVAGVVLAVPGAAPGSDRSPQPTLLVFHSPYCPVCRRMVPRIDALQRDCVGRELRIARVDVSDPEGAILAEQQGIAALPTVVLIGGDGGRIGQLLGEQSLAELRSAAAGLVQGVCGGEPPRRLDDGRAGPSCDPSAEALSCAG